MLTQISIPINGKFCEAYSTWTGVSPNLKDIWCRQWMINYNIQIIVYTCKNYRFIKWFNFVSGKVYVEVGG